MAGLQWVYRADCSGEGGQLMLSVPSYTVACLPPSQDLGLRDLVAMERAPWWPG